MRVLVFSESGSIRKYIEDLLTSTPYHFQAVNVDGMARRGAMKDFDAVMTDFQTWQRSVGMLRYFGTLEEINQRPLMIFSKVKRGGPLKLRSPKPFTVYCALPAPSEEFHGNLQQMANAMVHS